MLDIASISSDPAHVAMTSPASAISRQPLATLVPNSGIQFIDFVVTEARVAQTRRRYLEIAVDTDGEAERSLHPVAIVDGTVVHPITGAPVPPSDIYSIDGAAALAPFLESWLPVPFMRVSETADAEGFVLDEGPSNWTRIFVARDVDAQGQPVFRLVLAVDTSVDPSSERAGRVYAAPSIADVQSGAAYRFSDDVADVAWFVSEAWIDDWLSELFRAATDSRLAGARDT